MRPGRGVRIGWIAGIEIVADWSLMVIFMIITFSLAVGLFPAWHPDWSPAVSWVTAAVAAGLFFGSVLLHELSHALVGRAKGIEIRRITLFMFGGMAHMENEPPSWRAELWMAVVGPITSLGLGLGFGVLAGALAGPAASADLRGPGDALASLGPVATLLAWLAPVNIVLGLFNLVPGFPLDGGRVLRAILWGRSGDLVGATRRASRVGQGFALLLSVMGGLMILGFRVPFFGAGFVNGIWLVMIGWFLYGAAGSSYQQLVMREALEGVPVSQLMQTRFVVVPPGTRVSTLVNEIFMPSGQHAFPVEREGRLVGLVSLQDLEKRDPGSWEATAVEDIMTPADRLVTMSPWQGALEALAMFGRHDKSQLPVVEDGTLAGLVRKEDVAAWLSLRLKERTRPQLQGAG